MLDMTAYTFNPSSQGRGISLSSGLELHSEILSQTTKAKQTRASKMS